MVAWRQASEAEREWILANERQRLLANVKLAAVVLFVLFLAAVCVGSLVENSVARAAKPSIVVRQADGSYAAMETNNEKRESSGAIGAMLGVVVVAALCTGIVLLVQRQTYKELSLGLRVAEGRCVGKERYRSRYYSAYRMDIQLPGGEMLEGVRVDSDVYDKAKSGSGVVMATTPESEEVARVYCAKGEEPEKLPDE